METVRSPGRPMVHLHVTRRLFILLLLLLIAPWGLLAALWMAKDLFLRVEAARISTAAEADGRVTQARPGPWGALKCTVIAIEPPEEAVFVRPEDEAPPRWWFTGFTADKLRELFTAAGFTQEQMASLAARTGVDPATGTPVVSPTPEFVLEMTPAARQAIYRVLAAFPENTPQRFACTLQPKYVEERFERSGVSQAIVADIRRMLYPYGNILLFSDANIVLPRLSDPREKIRFLKMLAQKNSLLVNLQVTAASHVDELTGYWAVGGRSKDIRPLLESLRRTPGGASLDITHLLPRFARERLYTFPYSSGTKVEARRDCHWTSLNFFNSVPDDRYADVAFAVSTIREKYYAISTGAQLGDLALLLTSTDQLVHSAVYVADDIVFTKNGAKAANPWMLMKMEDLMELFEGAYQAEGPLHVMYYRKRPE
jgi:hypothetical protein